jgi:hypothetical protein
LGDKKKFSGGSFSKSGTHLAGCASWDFHYLCIFFLQDNYTQGNEYEYIINANILYLEKQ